MSMSMSMPMAMTRPLDGPGFPAFYSDPAPLESTEALCALDEMVAPVHQDNWCSRHFWTTEDHL